MRKSRVVNNKKKAFSVAEAMIALAIGGILLGLSAPLISRSVKNQNFSDVQYSVINKNFEKFKTETNTSLSSIMDEFRAMLDAFQSGINADLDKLDSKIDKAMPIGSIIMWSGFNIPENWALCDGTNGTPNLVNRFVVAAGSEYEIGDIGGYKNVTLEKKHMPEHAHEKGTMRIVGSLINDDANGEHLTLIDQVKDSGALKWGPLEIIGNGANSSGGQGGVRNQIYLDTDYDSNCWTGETSKVGESKEHENRPPYYALAYIMKIK